MTWTNPGKLLPPAVRAILYVITVGLAAAYAVIEANVQLHYLWQASYAAWNAMIGALAVSNVASASVEAEVVEPLGDPFDPIGAVSIPMVLVVVAVAIAFAAIVTQGGQWWFWPIAVIALGGAIVTSKGV